MDLEGLRMNLSALYITMILARWNSTGDLAKQSAQAKHSGS